MMLVMIGWIRGSEYYYLWIENWLFRIDREGKWLVTLLYFFLKSLARSPILLMKICVHVFFFLKKKLLL